MIVPMTAEDKAQAEGMGLDMGQAADPEGGTESMKTAMKTVIKASPFDRAMKVEAELNKLNGRFRSQGRRQGSGQAHRNRQEDRQIPPLHACSSSQA